MEENDKAMQRHEILCENPIREKSRGGGREFTIFQRLQ